MAINSNIAMGVQPMKIDGPADNYGKMLTLKSLLQKGEAGDLELQTAQETRQGKITLNDMIGKNIGPDGKINRPGLISGLAGAGQGAQIPGLQKTFNEQDKAQREAEKAQIESHLQKLDLGGRFLSSAKDQASYDAGKQAAQAAGLDVSNFPPQFDPAFIQSKLDQSMDVKTRLEQKWKAMQYSTPDANALLSAKTSRENNAASVGASYANAAATREIAKSTRDAAGMQRDRDTEMKLGDDYRTQSKDFKAVGDAYKQISATLDKATTSPAATLAAATKFMKLLDPGSVVRESELGMALAATGVFDRATNYVNTLKYGKVLTPDQAKDFKNITAQIYGAAQAGQKQVDASYRKQAETYKLRPEMVLQDLGQNTPAGGSNIDSLLDKYK